MSRKCGSCKKWLAAGQYTCKCGAGETQSALSTERKLLAQASLDKLKSVFRSGWHSVSSREAEWATVQKTVEFFRGDVEACKFASNNGDAWVRAIQSGSLELLELFLPHLSRPFHELRDLETGFTSPLFLAVVWGRKDCFMLCLKRHKDKIDWKFVEPKVGKTLQEFVLSKLEGEGFGYWNSSGMDYLWGNDLRNPSDEDYQVVTKRVYGELYDEINIACGFDTNMRGVKGMAIRAQQAAVAQEIVTPPPFPRHVWVLIVAKCDMRERDVVLPMCCRFFRNLSPPAERLANVKAAFGLDKALVDVPAAFVYLLCKSSSSVFLQRQLALLRESVYIGSNSVVRRFIFNAEIEVAPDSYYWARDVPTNPSPWVSYANSIEEDWICLKVGDLQMRLEIVEPKTGDIARQRIKISVQNQHKRISFSLKTAFRTDRFGYNAGGARELDRLADACNNVGAILGMDGLNPPRLIKMFTVLFSPCRPLPTGQVRWYGPAREEGPESFFDKMLLGESASLQIKLSNSLESSAAQEVAAEDSTSGESLGYALKALHWGPEQVGEFFSKHGLPQCAPVAVEKQITGRKLVEGKASSSDFVPASVTVTRERLDLIAKINELRKQYFGHKG